MQKYYMVIVCTFCTKAIFASIISYYVARPDDGLAKCTCDHTARRNRDTRILADYCRGWFAANLSEIGSRHPLEPSSPVLNGGEEGGWREGNRGPHPDPHSRHVAGTADGHSSSIEGHITASDHLKMLLR